MIPKDSTAAAAGPPSTSSRSSCFLGCFGFSGDKNNIIIMQPQVPINEIKEVNSTSRRRRRRWIPKWSFGCKKPLNDVVSPAKREGKWEIIQVVGEDPALTKKLTKKVIMEEQKVPGRKKWADIVRRENGSVGSRRKETKPAATSATGDGMEPKSQKKVTVAQPPFVSSPLKVPLTQSNPLPPAKKQKVPKPPTAGGGVDETVLRKTTPSGGEFDSVIAMGILLAILIIMLLWGKLCAIFFTCAWFLVVAAGKRTAVAAAEGRPPESPEKVNLESEEYKKKVVLEGLLQRNHRNVAGRLLLGEKRRKNTLGQSKEVNG
ncbi:hypothetical protein SSX86_004631 [Deinandra increscens subsp. villosa]|uniref:Uncharacterized protein n=1 Tax=Deinandra increscens subsp. villosa TaxID=3103831 RepID=A0AAP0DSF5_9ASTR